MIKLGRSKVEKAGVKENAVSIEDLICHEYTAEQLEEDKSIIDFDSAYDEAKQLDMKSKQEQIEKQ